MYEINDIIKLDKLIQLRNDFNDYSMNKDNKIIMKNILKLWFNKKTVNDVIIKCKIYFRYYNNENYYSIGCNSDFYYDTINSLWIYQGDLSNTVNVCDMNYGMNDNDYSIILNNNESCDDIMHEIKKELNNLKYNMTK